MLYLETTNSLGGLIKKHYYDVLPFITGKKLQNIINAFVEMKLKKTICTSNPFIYRVDPCTLCNLRCTSCNTYKIKTNEKRVMDFVNFREITEKIKKSAIRISLYDMGEPLLNKDIYKMIKYATDNNISTLISTNFNSFSKNDLTSLFDSGLTVLEPCLDGFTQETYETYRRGGDVERVKNGIKMVIQKKKEMKAKWPFVNVQVITFNHVIKELKKIRVFLKSCDVDKITYRKENLGFDSPLTFATDKIVPKRSPCFWLYVGMAVRPDGSVCPCDGRGINRFKYGNILKQSLSEIWNNKYYQFSRALFQKGPDLEYDEEMEAVPCLRCNEFRKYRKMKKKAITRQSVSCSHEARAM